FFKRYDEFRTVSEHVLRRTSTGEAPWHIVEASDPRWRGVAVGRIVLDALRDRLAAIRKEERPQHNPHMPVPEPVNVLSQLDRTLRLSDKAYERQVENIQGKLNRSVRKLGGAGHSAILVFEGPDAAGKGGAIRRLIACLDARHYQVTSVAAPTDEERAHPYLWRFWRNLPRRGRVTIYDRSWYGRVLVERLEGFATPEGGGRAYAEINGFEEQLVEYGIVGAKFWLAGAPEEQLRPFKERQVHPY